MDPSALLSSYPAMQSATAPLLAKGRDNVKWRLAVNFSGGLMYVCSYGHKSWLDFKGAGGVQWRNRAFYSRSGVLEQLK